MRLEPSLVKSLGLHAGLIALLFVSVNFTAEPTPSPIANAPVIQATFIDAQAIADKQREERERQAEIKRQEALRKEKQRKAQEAKRRKEAQAKKAAEQKRKKEQERIAEQKRQQELKKKAAEEAKRKRELAEARKRKKEEEKKQAELDKLLNEQLETERKAQAARRNQQVLNEVQRYKAEIHALIQRHIIEDPAFSGKQCRLNIRLASTGFVTSVKKLSGDPALCRLAENAVIREEKLPVSDDLAVYEQLKNINLTVALK